MIRNINFDFCTFLSFNSYVVTIVKESSVNMEKWDNLRSSVSMSESFVNPFHATGLFLYTLKTS